MDDKTQIKIYQTRLALLKKFPSHIAKCIYSFIHNYYIDLKEVTRMGNYLYNVDIKNQTVELCLAAIISNPMAIRYVKKQKKRLCLEAVKRNGWVIHYVRNQTPKIIQVACATTPQAFIEIRVKNETKKFLYTLKNITKLQKKNEIKKILIEKKLKHIRNKILMEKNDLRLTTFKNIETKLIQNYLKL